MTIKDINSHQKACEVLGKDPKESAIVQDQLEDIANAINAVDNNYVADFNNSDAKWRPFFIVDASGFRFVISGCDISRSDADVGSRLCFYFRKEEHADHFGKTFEDLHRKLFNTTQRRTMKFQDITSHEIACRIIEKDPTESNTTDRKITDLCKAMNKLSGFVPDFKDPNQKKWRPYFVMDASGFRFGDSSFDISHSSTVVGSRLCHFVGSKEEANYLGNQFFDLHKAHYLGE